MSSVARVLLADADVRRADRLCKHLSTQGFHLTLQCDALHLKQQLITADVDVLILHSDLQPTSALEISRDLREQGKIIPILILNETPHYTGRVAALQAGADDVLSTPYALEELVARLHSLLRRSRMGRQDSAGALLHYGDLMVNTDGRQVSRAGQPIKLTVKEYDLLLCLLRHQQQVLPRQRILHLVWGDTWVGDDNLLDVYIRYLRKKLERPDLEPLIHTVRGVGFMLK